MTALCRYCREQPTDAESGICATCANPQHEAAYQTLEAERELDRPAVQYLRWPWPSLDQVYGGMAPGTVHYVVGYSGTGKTTFSTSALLEWAAQGVAIDVLPLEIRAGTFRTWLAALQCQLDPGLLLSGDFAKRDPLEAEAIRERVRAKLREMRDTVGRFLRIRGVRAVNVHVLRDVVGEAVSRGAKAVLVDHIDHVASGDGKRAADYQAAVEVNGEALDIAQSHDVTLICMSQANLSAVRASKDHLGKYAPPRDDAILMGGEKLRVASGMLGLFRPVRLPAPGETADAYKEAIKRARDGVDEPYRALMQGVAGCVLMKSRSYGSRAGARVLLGYEAGRITELPLDRRYELEAREHGIRTGGLAA